MHTEISKNVIKKLITDFFDRPIMGNTARGFFAEAMVAEILGEDWALVSQDWAGWDIENINGCKVEIKQSAYFQSWDRGIETKNVKPNPRFDIAPRKGQWINNKWVEEAGRAADYYIFCWHPEAKEKKVDHRDVNQWKFTIVKASEFKKDQKSIGWSILKKMSPILNYNEIKPEMDKISAKITE